jgi:hypothetical protein
MYDDASLRRSEYYFAVLQLLRIFSEWIRQSMDDMDKMISEIDAEMVPWLIGEPDDSVLRMSTAVLKSNWTEVGQMQKRLGQALLERIQKKQDEVKSLRDGVRYCPEPGNVPSQANGRVSSSTRNRYGKPSRARRLTSISSFLQ